MLILKIHSTPLLSRGDIHMKQKLIFVDRLGTFRVSHPKCALFVSPIV